MGDNEVIEVPSSPENQGSPVRDIVCLKEEFYMREIEEIEDCFILDFEPNDSIDLSKLFMSNDLHNPVAPGIYVLAEHDQVACRDYPHSRHLCLKNRFEKTPHETYCELCYCFVCDKAAPCTNWLGVSGHCHATSSHEWKCLRRKMRNSPIYSDSDDSTRY
ncbi:Mediator of RNA polymerase II transcription subunit like [Actinidia chinensis var. chinensis]|uniref:Mediator of RNA polymerase II transcription subunit like n=1 Tax=Actinidia chinensis var. chinensis TaxID=1590841 RepID=A0A2R6Q9D9_ACTCC|nr:Mediator of RNA polymerase II transcription subunit like [Actinidia chinensis var. chinensis]